MKACRWIGPAVILGPPLGFSPIYGTTYHFEDHIADDLASQGKVELMGHVADTPPGPPTQPLRHDVGDKGDKP